MLSVRLNRQRLRALREDRELTTEQFATLVSAELGRKVHQSTISKYENGTRQPSARTFGALCRVLRVAKDEMRIPNTPDPSEATAGPADAAPGTRTGEATASDAAAPSKAAS